MKAVILAAGMGERLRPHTDDRPKAMVWVGDQPLLFYTLTALANVGITDVAVVGGYCAPLLFDWIGTHTSQVTTILNPDYTHGSILTIAAAREFCGTDDFVVCNADHLYNPGIWQLVPYPSQTIRAFCDFDRPLGADDMKIATDQRSTIRAIHKQLTTFDGGYIGMTTVPALAAAAYWNALDATRERWGTSASVEWILGECIAQQVPVTVCDASGHGWAEVDTPDELVQARAFVAERAA